MAKVSVIVKHIDQVDSGQKICDKDPSIKNVGLKICQKNDHFRYQFEH